jgi:hypothetical protein
MTPGSSPLPDIAEVVGVTPPARARSRLTRVGGLVLLAAVVTVIVIGTQGGRPHRAPAPTHPTASGEPASEESLPLGAAPRVPYLIGEGLYLDGRSRPGTWNGLSVAGRSATGFRSTPDQDGAVVVLRDGRVVLTLTTLPWSGAVLSPDGNLVAWAEVDRDRTVGHVVLHDLRTGTDVARLEVDPMLLTVDDDRVERLIRLGNDGTVVYGGLHGWHTWKPGSPPVDTPTPADGSPLTPGFPARSNPVWLSPDESWGAWLTRRDGSNPPPDTGGTGLLEGLTLQRPGDPASRFTIALPIGTDAAWLTWETGSDVLVTVDDLRLNSPAYYLRCHVVEKDCEQAPTPFDP